MKRIIAITIISILTQLSFAQNFGIGTNNPQKKLDVRGEARSTVNGVNFYMVPEGAIIMWSGSLNSIPSGWQLCDGTNGTPDLRNRFVYGVGSGENPGATGGSTSHQHKTPIALDGGTGGSGMRVGDDNNGNSSLWGYETGPSVNVKADEVNQLTTGNRWALTDSRSNLPPYYKIAYIMKL